MNTRHSGAKDTRITPRSTPASHDSNHDLASVRIGHRSGRALDLIREHIDASRASAAARLLTKPAAHAIIATPKLRDLVINPRKVPSKAERTETLPTGLHFDASSALQSPTKQDSLIDRMGRTMLKYRNKIAAVAVAATLSLGAAATWFLNKGETDTKHLGGSVGKDSGAEVVKANKAEPPHSLQTQKPKNPTAPTPQAHPSPQANELKATEAKSSPPQTATGERPPQEATKDSTPSKQPTVAPHPTPPEASPAPTTASSSAVQKRDDTTPTTSTERKQQGTSPKSEPAALNTPADKKVPATAKAPTANSAASVAKAAAITNNEEMLKSLGKRITTYMRSGETIASQKAKRDSMSAKAWEALVWDEAKASAAKEGINLSTIVQQRNSLRSLVAQQERANSQQRPPQVQKNGAGPVPFKAPKNAHKEGVPQTIDKLVPPGGKLHVTTSGKPFLTGFQRSVVTDDNGREIARVTRTKILGLTVWKSTAPLSGVDHDTAQEVVRVLDDARRAAIQSK